MAPTLRRLVVFAILAVLPLAQARAQSDIGIVVLHGKQGTSYDRAIGPFLQALQTAGYRVQSPTMCWSRTRIYDATFPDCLREVDRAVAALRAAGARRIVVAGESLGGDAALVYGVQHPELAGVIALAPAGQPEAMLRNSDVADSLARAQQMVAAGKGNERAGFTDVNLGQPFVVNTTAAIYVSFFARGGPADFPIVLPNERVPVIWVAGSADRSQSHAAESFARIPANPLNHLAQVNAGHLDTPTAGTTAVLEWLKTLPVR